jgi:hypothetical protein
VKQQSICRMLARISRCPEILIFPQASSSSMNSGFSYMSILVDYSSAILPLILFAPLLLFLNVSPDAHNACHQIMPQ